MDKVILTPKNIVYTEKKKTPNRKPYLPQNHADPD